MAGVDDRQDRACTALKDPVGIGMDARTLAAPLEIMVFVLSHHPYQVKFAAFVQCGKRDSPNIFVASYTKGPERA